MYIYKGYSKNGIEPRSKTYQAIYEMIEEYGYNVEDFNLDMLVSEVIKISRK